MKDENGTFSSDFDIELTRTYLFPCFIWRNTTPEWTESFAPVPFLGHWALSSIAHPCYERKTHSLCKHSSCNKLWNSLGLINGIRCRWRYRTYKKTIGVFIILFLCQHSMLYDINKFSFLLQKLFQPTKLSTNKQKPIKSTNNTRMSHHPNLFTSPKQGGIL